MQEEPVLPLSESRRWLVGVLQDRSFHGVFLIWALCCLAVLLCTAKFGMPLPWCDEWTLTSIACGQKSLSWSWLWEPANEHRMPLTRLSVLVIGRLSHWNWQAMHYINFAFMGLGALSLLFAARSVRGRAALSDTFLCFVVLTPWHWQTIWRYGYAYGIAGGLMCLAISLAAVRWPQRSRLHLVSYAAILLAITLAGGPPGNFLALGLVCALVPNFREATRTWIVSAAVTGGLVAAVSLLFLVCIPTAPHHANFISDSLKTTLKAASKESVCWIGAPVLQMLWPWAILVGLIPGLWIVGRMIRDVVRWRRGNGQPMREWADLSSILLAGLMVAAAIAYGRARLSLWDSRYVVLTMPIGIVLYLLLVRMRAPLALPQSLAVVMAICFGWCWPLVLNQEQVHRDKAVEFIRTLSQGNVPLCDLCNRYSHYVGLDGGEPILQFMVQLRQHEKSIFRAINRKKRRAGIALPQAWKAESGVLEEGWTIVADVDATQARALHRSATDKQPARVAYRVQVDAASVYRLCCRLRSPKEQVLSVAVDGKQLPQQTFPAAPDYRPYLLTVPFPLEPGQHDLALSFSPGDVNFDLVELLPQ